MPNMPFNVEEYPMQHVGVRQVAVVITAKNAMVVGRERIQRLRRPTGMNDVDRWLLEQAASRADRAKVVLFRAVNNDGDRVWQFDPSLNDNELEEGGYVLTRALLPLHRRVLASGMVLMVHTDWGLRECYAMRHGVRKLKAELQKSAGKADPVVEADRWILSNMLLHVALSMNHVVTELLPGHLAMLERRRVFLKTLVASLPASAID
jgi:hypothetical protein